VDLAVRDWSCGAGLRGCVRGPPALPAVAGHQGAGTAHRGDRHLLADIAALEEEIKVLLADTDGQVLTSPPGVAVNRAAALAAQSLPIARLPDADHLYSATGLAPATYESATLRRRGTDLPSGAG
jgi:transposase